MSPVSSLTTASCPAASDPLGLWWSTGTSSRSPFTATTTTRISSDSRTGTSVAGRACSTHTSLKAMHPCSSGGSKCKTGAATSATPAREKAARRCLSTWRSKVSQTRWNSTSICDFTLTSKYVWKRCEICQTLPLDVTIPHTLGLWWQQQWVTRCYDICDPVWGDAHWVLSIFPI